MQKDAEQPAPPSVSCSPESADVSDKGHIPPCVEIPFMRTPPGIGAEYNAREWQPAALLQPFLAPVSGAPAQPRVRCRMGMDERCFYASFECDSHPEEHSPFMSGEKEGEEAAPDDRIEWFIRPDDSAPCRYFMFIIPRGGECYAKTKVKNGSGGAAKIDDAPMERPWQVKVSEMEGGWRAEAVIPWSTLELKTGGIRGLRLNVCRSMTIPGTHLRTHSSWAYLPMMIFNWSEKFGVALCVFDRPNRAMLSPADIGLDTSGLCLARRTDLGFPAADSFELVCASAFPKHPLLPGLDEVQLSVDMEPMGANGTGAEHVSLGDFTLAANEHKRLVVGGLSRDDYQLRLRFQSAGFSHEAIVPVMAKTFKAIEKKLNSLPDMARKSPYRAAGYLGLAACLDRIRRHVALENDPRDISLCMREAQTRMQVLGDGSITDHGDGLLALLRLGRDPEAQVAVEYLHRERTATITFHCGSLPLTSVQVQEYESESEALRMLTGFLDRRKGSIMLDSSAEQTRIAGQPARIHANIYDPWSHRPMIAPYDPARQVLLADLEARSAMAMDPAYLHCALVDAAIIMENCPAEVRTTVTDWARTRKIPLPALEAANGFKHVLIAGGPPDADGPLEMRELSALYPMSETVNGVICAAAVRGRNLYSIWQVPRAMAVNMLELVMAGNPIRPEQVDALRMDIVRYYGPKQRPPAAPPAELRPCCGDVHTHTSYSHGIDESTPIGLTLESMYCFMDFIVISDHDRIDGAQKAGELCRAHNLDYTLMVGAELGVCRAHLNAYPLKQLIRADSPMEAVEMARQQGALIQWNHPNSDVATMKELSGDRFDAWEHLPRQFYDEWERTGTLPVLTGSSDTHTGTFCFFKFGHFERTLVLADSCRETDIVAGIRRKRALLVTPAGGKFFYGPADPAAMAWSALAEGEGLKAAKAEQLRTALANADIVGLLADNHPIEGR